jgi:hypothetical protein
MLLGCGWALMVAGVLLLMDACVHYRPDCSALAGAESVVGFGVAVTGWLLRRTALAKAAARKNIDEDRA